MKEGRKEGKEEAGGALKKMGGDRSTRNATRIIATCGTNQNAAMTSNEISVFKLNNPVGETSSASFSGFCKAPKM